MNVHETVGKFRIESKLGAGGMGEVWKAWDTAIRRWVALKFLKDPRDAPRFRREAQLAARLDHPNIAAVYEVGDHGGAPFIAMQYVDGTTLSPGMNRRESVAAIRDAARAVAAAHAQGIVHRDLKPSNLMKDAAGRLYVMDFGLARSTEIASGLTQTGIMVGTPAYMSPEQARGEPADARSDLFGLGATLYELVTGRLPFDGADLLSVVMRVINDDPTPPRAINAAISQDLETVILACLEKEPSRRYASAADLADDLDRVIAGEPVAARRSGALARVARKLSRRKAVLATTLAAVVTVVGISAWLAVALGRGRTETASAEQNLVGQMRTTSDACLHAALDRRRTGDLDGMRKASEQVIVACGRVKTALPALAEPYHRVGRILRAQMRMDEALAEQNAAIIKDSGHAAARYERIILNHARLRARVREAAEAWWVRASRRWADEGGQSTLVRKLPSKRNLADTDAEAGRLMAALKEDLDAIAVGALGPGETLLLDALRCWLMRDAEAAVARLRESLNADAGLEESYEMLAWLALEKADFAEVDRLLTEAIDRDRGYLDHVEARANARGEWGRTLRAHGRESRPTFESALADYDDVFRRDPSRLRAAFDAVGIRIELAIANHAAGADAVPLLRGAVEACDRLLAARPGWGDAVFRRGVARVDWALQPRLSAEEEQALLRDAIEDLRRALELLPDRDEVWGAYGAAMINRGFARGERGEDPLPDFDAAIAALTKAMDLHPGDVGTVRDRANAYLNLAEYNGRHGRDPSDAYRLGLADFDRALKLAPLDAATLVRRGSLVMNRAGYRQGSGEEVADLFKAAIADFDAAMKASPSWDEPWLGRARCLENWAGVLRRSGGNPTSTFEAAVADYAEAIRRNPERPEGWQGRGVTNGDWALYVAEVGGNPEPKFEEADRSLGKAIELRPHAYNSYVDRGGMRVNWGGHLHRRGGDGEPKLATAIEDLDRAVKLNPGAAVAREFRGNAHYILAQVLSRKKGKVAPEIRAAAADYEEAIRIDPALKARLEPLLRNLRTYLKNHPDE